MANETMVLLEKIVVPSAGASSITFTSIPQSYTDLKLVFSTRVDVGGGQNGFYISLNSSTASFSAKQIQGDGSSAASFSITRFAGYSDASGATANTFSNGELYFPNYASSNNKSFSGDAVQENNATTAYILIGAHLWSNSAAITTITLTPDTANFVQYSTFYLYGVAKQGVTPTNAPAATGGDSIVFDGTYWIHTFRSSGTFTPKKGLTCDYLVVAGGGAGGTSNAGGGGGAGGLRSTVTATGGGGSLESALSLLANTNYTVTVGGGGASGANGSNSVFSTITSTGGGRGGAGFSESGFSGGSGGGACGSGAPGKVGGAGTANQGYAGGASSPAGSSVDPAGGGGGSGAVGGASSGSVAGNGGAGVATSITGSSVTYAGGGGGGASTSGTAGSGSNGGGNGVNSGNGNAATVNTGSGGGGCGAGTGGSGGSGIVIVRYAA